MNVNRLKCIVSVAVLSTSLHAKAIDVEVLRVPGGGIQPQAAMGADGTLHLVYYLGDPAAGDLFYTRRVPGEPDFGSPIRVNKQPGSAIAMGTIRGAQLALGKDDRVHVAWMGSAKSKQPDPEGTHPEHPMWYTRLNNGGTAFEPERDVMTWTGGLDGGGSVAADSRGNVFVAWHGRGPDAVEGEAGRAMFVSVSQDEGATFAREFQANAGPTGSCACCGMRAFMDEQDRIHLLYRSANQLSRDMTLLSSDDHGRSFKTATVNRWFTQSCPMSSAAIASHGGQLWVVTERSGNVELCEWTNTSGSSGAPKEVSLSPGKHPSISINEDRVVLVAWAEDAGWGRGGRLRWQKFGADGRPIGEIGGGEDIPTWSLPAVVAHGNQFIILF